MNVSLATARIVFAAWVLAVYGVAVVYMGGLSFEPVKDEAQFWKQIIAFVEIWPPSIEDLRNYNEPMTPVSFLIWAGLEHVHGLGVAPARLLSILIGLAVLAWVGLREPSPGAGRFTPIFAALALLAYPYWIPMSVLLYTDLPAAVFVMLGCYFYRRDQHLAGALFFALGIATRQYMVVFPAALVAHEGLRGLRGNAIEWKRLVPYAVSAVTLLGWIAFFGGVGPADGLAEWPRHQNALDSMSLAYSLYFLAAVGAYFVLPEWVIDRVGGQPKLELDRVAILAWGVLVIAFLIDTPSYASEIGPLNRTVAYLLSYTGSADLIRPFVMFTFASATVIRFVRFDLATWLVLANTCLMAFMWSPWEKYCMPLLGALWLLKSMGALDAASDARDDGATVVA
ncbi:MAG: hypothetical protein QF570_07415 [Myxococcota bacterium]|jgi:hypothetical protein|nr:hypothetical protein [Myxococcota bacterium]